MGRNQPIDSVINLICREFHVNKTWLRTGDEEISRFLEEVRADKSGFRKKLLLVMARMTAEEWEILEQIVMKLTDEMNHNEV